jgi:GntR family transcriptional regulator
MIDDRAADPGRAARPAVFSPLYQQIKDLLVQSLERGEWKPGEVIPSEIDLAARFQVSQGTVRKAVDELAAEHLLVRRQGKGTFVATHHEARAQYRFLRIVPDEGDPVARGQPLPRMPPQGATSDWRACSTVRAGDPLVYVRRLLTFDGTPVVLDDIWLPGATVQGPHRRTPGRIQGTALWSLRNRVRDSDDPRRRADPGGGCGRRSRGAARGRDGLDPLLLVERVSTTYGERPVELRRGRTVTTAHHYRNTLS